MKAKLSFDEVVEFEQNSEQTVRIRQGKGFDFSLVDFEGDMSLKITTGENDQVISVVDDDRANGHIGARITADGPGLTEVQIQKNRQVVFWLGVNVWNEEAASFEVPPPVTEPIA